MESSIIYTFLSKVFNSTNVAKDLGGKIFAQ